MCLEAPLVTEPFRRIRKTTGYAGGFLLSHTKSFSQRGRFERLLLEEELSPKATEEV